MHASSESSNLISKVLEGGIWKVGYTKSIQRQTIQLQTYKNSFALIPALTMHENM